MFVSLYAVEGIGTLEKRFKSYRAIVNSREEITGTIAIKLLQQGMEIEIIKAVTGLSSWQSEHIKGHLCE